MRQVANLFGMHTRRHAYAHLPELLQPAGHFVARPPLDWNLAGPSLCLAIFVWLTAVGFLGLSSFRAAHSDFSTMLQACDLPTDSARCKETTIYPKHLMVPLNGYASFEVVLHGPSRLSTSQIADAISGMTCEVNTTDGFTIFTTYALPSNKPFNFQRSCTNPSVPEITLRPQYDNLGGFPELLNMLKLANALNYSGGGSNNSGFEVVGITGVRTKHLSQWYGIVIVNFAFKDGSSYAISVDQPCDGSPLSENFWRDCFRGYPYSPPWSSMSHPEQCPMQMSQSAAAASQFYHSLPREFELARRSASEFCVGFAMPCLAFLESYENTSLHQPRPANQLPQVIADGIAQQCPYSFQCTVSQFRGPLIWLAALYPAALLVGKLLLSVLQWLYHVLYNLRVKANSDAKNAEADNQEAENIVLRIPVEGIGTPAQLCDSLADQEGSDPAAQQERQKAPQESIATGTAFANAECFDVEVRSSPANIGAPRIPPGDGIAAAECLNKIDIELLCGFPDVVAKINQRLAQLEAVVERLGAQLELHDGEISGKADSVQSILMEDNIAPIKRYIKAALSVELQPVWIRDMTTSPILKASLKTALIAEIQPIWRREVDNLAQASKQAIAGLEAQFVNFRSQLGCGPSNMVREKSRIGFDNSGPSSHLEHLESFLHLELKRLRVEVADLAYLVDQGLCPSSDHRRASGLASGAMEKLPQQLML